MAQDIHEPEKVEDAYHAAALGEKWREERASTEGNRAQPRHPLAQDYSKPLDTKNYRPF
jgi:hypothetical protein